MTSPMKKSLKLRAVVSPTPAIIAAAYDENGKADACTLAFYTPTSHKPPCLTIAINATAKRKTLKSILGSGAFTIGYPSIGQAAEADWIGMASGYEHDKIAEVGWTTTKAEKVNAPVINELKLTVGPLTYTVSILLTFGVSLFVGWMVARKNRKIDMVEALKNAE